MTETVEIVTTRIYTVGDIKKILAPYNRGLDVSITTTIREPYNKDKK